MYLKSSNTKLELNISRSNSCLGLSNGDCWCLVDFYIQNNDVYLESSISLISYYEYTNFMDELRLFLNDNSIYKKRFTFIKNYFVIYLESGIRIGKRMRIKLVHFNENSDNYELCLHNKEIFNFLEVLESYRDKI